MEGGDDDSITFASNYETDVDLPDPYVSLMQMG